MLPCDQYYAIARQRRACRRNTKEDRDGSSERNPTAGENACRPAGGWRCERRRACEEHNRLAEHPEVREKLSADGGPLGVLGESANPNSWKPDSEGVRQEAGGWTRDRRVDRHSG